MKVLRVATFNIQHGRGPDGRVDVSRLADACASLDTDILGLQEVDVGVGRSHRADLAGVVAVATGTHATFAPAVAMDGGQYGIALLTRLVPRRVEVVPLPTGDRREPRVALLARVGHLSVAVTHLSVGSDLHAQQLTVVLDALRARPGPRLLLGDLNHDDPALDGLARADTPPTWPADTPRRRLDHIAVDGLVVRDVFAVELPVSDHRAVVATVTRTRA